MTKPIGGSLPCAEAEPELDWHILTIGPPAARATPSWSRKRPEAPGRHRLASRASQVERIATLISQAVQ